MVYAKNTETGEEGYKKVVQLFVKEVDILVYLTVDGEEIVTTKNHTFYIKDTGFIEAETLKVGDTLLSADGTEKQVEDVSIKQLQSTMKVYNFEVEDWHTYYVAGVEVLVHNDCNVPKEVHNSIKESSNYPNGFQARKNGTTSNKVNNLELLESLKKVESSSWKKVYKDGYDANGNKVSIHYFQSQSGKVFNVKVKKDGAINNMKTRFFESKDKRIDEKILLIAVIGSLEAIKNGGIIIDEGEKFIFSPYMCEILKEKGCKSEIVNLIERGCELEDIESLIPHKLEKAINDIKQDAMEILKGYEIFDEMMWIEELE